MAEQYPFLIWMTGAIIITLSLFSLFIIKGHLKNKNRRNFICILVLSVIFIFSASSLGYFIQDYNQELGHHTLYYLVELKSESWENQTVYIPISADRNLQNSVEIISGDGQFDIVESEYGVCLEVTFIGNIELNAFFETNVGLSNHDLTMENGSRPNLDPNVELWEYIEYWIYLKPTNRPDCSISLKLRFTHETYDWWEIHKFEGNIKYGWDTYWAEHEAIS